jgi:hypothetical protein
MKHICEICNYETKYKSHLRNHLNSEKHKRVVLIQENQKNPTQSQNGDFSDFPEQKKGNIITYAIANLNNGEDTSSDSDSNSASSNKATTKLLELDSSSLTKCNKCLLEFTQRVNMLRHSRTCNFDKLKTLVEDTSTSDKLLIDNKCPLCKLQCVNKSGLVKHVNSCVSKKINSIASDNTKVQLLQLENKLLHEKESIRKEHVSDLQKGLSHGRKMDIATSCNMNGIIQTTMRAMTFATTHYNTAPALENFDTDFKDPYTFYIDYDEFPEVADDNTKIIVDNKEITKNEFIVEHIAFLVEHKKVVKYYTEKIAHFYKKEEPHKQSLWNFDTSRHNYGISVKSNDKVYWQKDKQGLTTTKKILDPMLRFTIDIIKSLVPNYLSKLSQSSLLMKKVAYLSDFVNSVETNTLQPEIIKKLSPIMFLDVVKQITYN